MNAKRIALVVAAGAMATLLLAAGVVLRELHGHGAIAPIETSWSASSEQVTRGEYLARIGNCAGCHTARGGEPYAGGNAVNTPFGAVYASNLTPDKATGIGAWSADAFYRAMHEGRSRDGHLLYPAFPYPNISLTSREDADAIYAFLMNRIAPVKRENTAHTLHFPYNTQLALAAWRVLYFTPETFAPNASQPAAWNRGAYLVQGLAHCGACHSARNALGATIAGHAYDGAMMPLNDWYAPSLTARNEASVADWDLAQISAWLKHGISERGAALGPMAEVVYQSTQYLRDDDATAMVTYLKVLPVSETSLAPRASTDRKPETQGERLYGEHCKNCHGDRGEGKSGAFPALAGNRAVTMVNANNLIQVVLAGGFAPATTGNPRPHGMPPYYHVLSDAEIAKILTFIRASWGNDAAAVTELDMAKFRNALRTP